MNNKRVDTKEISDILILFTFLVTITLLQVTVIGGKPLDGASVLSKGEYLLYLSKYVLYIVFHSILIFKKIFKDKFITVIIREMNSPSPWVIWEMVISILNFYLIVNIYWKYVKSVSQLE